MREYDDESISVRDSVKSMYDFFEPTSRKMHSWFVVAAVFVVTVLVSINGVGGGGGGDDDDDVDNCISMAPSSNAIDDCLLLCFFNKTFASVAIFRTDFVRTSDFGGDLFSSLSAFV